MARLSPREETRSILRPYGVWAVISPFNFPAALAGGPIGGALVAGNTVVLKPSQETPLTAAALHSASAMPGCPPPPCTWCTGRGEPTGRALAEHPQVDGLLFTGSKAMGLALRQRFAGAFPRPCIAEMGGKNPALVMPSADLDAAAEGVMRSAFGLQGQKCSACSRVYVHASVRDAFTDLLLEKTRALTMGDPSRHGVFLGPVIHERAFDAYAAYAALARARRPRPSRRGDPPRGRARARILRGADDRRGPARRASAHARRAVRALRGRERGRRRSRRP